MPEITSDTPRTDITIAGETFSVPQPYSEGQPLSANEASALNQTYAENIRNNLASKVKEQKEAGSFNAEVFQGQVDDYCDIYEFGVRTGGGGRAGDPIQVEAMAIAREAVRRAIQKQGKKLADVPASKITELARGVLARGDDKAEQILATAKARVAAAAELTDVDIGSVDSTETEATPKGKAKAKADA